METDIIIYINPSWLCAPLITLSFLDVYGLNFIPKPFSTQVDKISKSFVKHASEEKRYLSVIMVSVSEVPRHSTK